VWTVLVGPGGRLQLDIIANDSIRSGQVSPPATPEQHVLFFSTVIFGHDEKNKSKRYAKFKLHKRQWYPAFAPKKPRSQRYFNQRPGLNQCGISRSKTAKKNPTPRTLQAQQTEPKRN
jgi:hypothetical protein